MTDRRLFLKNMGCLVVGIPLLNACGNVVASVPMQDQLPGSLRRDASIDSWIEILDSNQIRVFTGKIELGQGITTVIRQVAAEELNASLDQVEVITSDTERTPDEGYTAGSGSVKGSAMAVRYAAAAAHKKLLEMASDQSGIAIEKLRLKEGVVSDESKTYQGTMVDLLQGQRWETEVQLPLPLKSPDAYQYVGKAIARADHQKIVRGEPFFVHDLEFADVLHARVIRPSSYEGVLESVPDVDVPDVDVVRDGNFLAVVGAKEYDVVKAAVHLASATKWKATRELSDFKSLKQDLPGMVDNTETVEHKGETVVEGTRFSGSFYKPYIMHGSIGPACGIALFEEGKFTIWTHSQGVFPFRSALASMLDVEEDKVHVIGLPGAGCFGHNCSDDAAADAAIIARKYLGRHVRVQWSRIEEHQWEALGCAMRMDVEAILSSDNKIQAWSAEVYSDSHSTRPNRDAGTLLTARYLEDSTALQGRGYLGGGHRNAAPYYSIPALDVKAHFYQGPLRVSSLRSLGAYANIFAIESLMDEMAYSRDIDPFEFRIHHLEDERAIGVIRKLQEMMKGTMIASGQGLGMAFSRYKNSDAYCAVGVYLEVSQEGEVSLIQMWAALDAGEVMNTDGLINQTEGGMIQAASWTLREEVVFDENQITSSHWGSYPIFRYNDIPRVEVALVRPPDVSPLGGGEAATPPTPAAITNAIFRATGHRIYNLPVDPKKLQS